MSLNPVKKTLKSWFYCMSLGLDDTLSLMGPSPLLEKLRFDLKETSSFAVLPFRIKTSSLLFSLAAKPAFDFFPFPFRWFAGAYESIFREAPNFFCAGKSPLPWTNLRITPVPPSFLETSSFFQTPPSFPPFPFPSSPPFSPVGCPHSSSDQERFQTPRSTAQYFPARKICCSSNRASPFSEVFRQLDLLPVAVS